MQLAVAAQSSVVDPNEIFTACQELYKRTQRPIFITRGDRGCILFNNPESEMVEIPAVPVEGPIDIVRCRRQLFNRYGNISLRWGGIWGGGINWESCWLRSLFNKSGTTGTASRAQDH